MRLAKSVVGQRELEALAHVIEVGYLAMGADVQSFELELAEYLQTEREVVCVNTGTAALHLALQACDVGPGDEVLVPSLTYVASFQAVSATGATPVACEVRRETVCLDVEDAAKRITPKTKAIMPVHFTGNTGDLDAVYDLAKKHQLRVIEDAAQAFGCSHGAEFLGARGDITCFSFDGIKNINLRRRGSCSYRRSGGNREGKRRSFACSTERYGKALCWSEELGIRCS